MKGFKKGIALIAVLAFLITAVLPAAAFAAGPQAVPETRAAVITNASATITIDRTSSMPTDPSLYRLGASSTTPDAPEIQSSDYQVTMSAGNTQVIIEINPGVLNKAGTWTYQLYFIQNPTGFPMPLGNITIEVVDATATGQISWSAGANIDSVTVKDAAGNDLASGTDLAATVTSVSITVAAAAGADTATVKVAVYSPANFPAANITGSYPNFTITGIDPAAGLQFGVTAQMPAPAPALQPIDAPAGVTVTDADGKAITEAPTGATVTVTVPEDAEGPYEVRNANGEVLATIDPGNSADVEMPEGGITIVPAEVLQPVNAPAGITVTDADGNEVTEAPAGATLTISVPEDAEGPYDVTDSEGNVLATIEPGHSADVEMPEGGIDIVLADAEPGDKTGLEDAIAEATANKDNTEESGDGTDVLPGTDWVDAGTMQALQDAIDAAQEVADNPDATQAQIDAALAALQEAVDAFDAAKQEGTQDATTDDLGNLTAEAQDPGTGLPSAVISEDGSDVPEGQDWVPQDVYDALQDAIENAQTVAADPDATQDEINEAYAALKRALDAFDKAKAPGTGTQDITFEAEGFDNATSTLTLPDTGKVTLTPSPAGGKWSPSPLPAGVSVKNGALTFDPSQMTGPAKLTYTDEEGNSRTITVTGEYGLEWTYAPWAILEGASDTYVAQQVGGKWWPANVKQYNVVIGDDNVITAPTTATATANGATVAVTAPAGSSGGTTIQLVAISTNNRIIAETTARGVNVVTEADVAALIRPVNPAQPYDYDTEEQTEPANPAVFRAPAAVSGTYVMDAVTSATFTDADGNPVVPSIGVTPIAGLQYKWAGNAVVTSANGTGATTTPVTPNTPVALGARVILPTNAGQYNYTVTPVLNGKSLQSIKFSVLVQGQMDSELEVEGVGVRNNTSYIGVLPNAPSKGTGNQITANWLTDGSIGAPGRSCAEYLWHVHGKADWTAVLQPVNSGTGIDFVRLGNSEEGAIWRTWGPGANSVLLTNVGLNETLTVECEPIVPGTFTAAAAGRSALTDGLAQEDIDLYDGGQTGLAQQAGNRWEMPTAGAWGETAGGAAGQVTSMLFELIAVTNSNAAAPDILNAWIGEPLDQSLTAMWFPAAPANNTVGHWVMQPLDNGATIGQEVIVTPNSYNENVLTFTTTGPIVGNVSGIHTYNLIAYTAGTGTSRTEIDQIQVDLHIHLRKPYLHTQNAQLAPGIDAPANLVAEQPANGTQYPYDVYAVWGTDKRGNVYTQTDNLPVFSLIATMEGGDASGWTQTEWAISSQSPQDIDPVDGQITIEDFNDAQIMTKVSAGAEQNGDLYAYKTVQPSEIMAAYRLNEANGSLNATIQNTLPLYYYAKVQYGSNPNCSRVTQVPFTLYIVRDGEQYFYALNANGQIPALGAIPPQIGQAPLPNGQTVNARVAEITAVVNSKAPTNLNTLWIPKWEPSKLYTDFSGYNWYFESGPAAVTIGSASVPPAAGTVIQGATSQNLSVTNFTVPGRYRFICWPTTTSGRPLVNAQAVLFEVNVGNIATTSYSDQSQYYATWIQPPTGYFSDSKNAPVFTEAGKNSDYPTPPVVNASTSYGLGTLGSMLTIGKVTGLSVDGASWIDGATVPVSLNSRFQLYFDPSGIQYGTKENGEPNWLSANPESPNYWKDFVVLEWRYKTSQYMEDDGNSGNIPRGMGFSGVNSPMLTSGPLTAAMDGWQFALEIHDKKDENVYTTTRWVLLDLDGMNPATQPEASISSYPAANGSAVSLTAGSDVTFSASAQGSIPVSDLTYQWQSRPAVSQATPDPQWANITGATESTYALSNVTMDQNGTEIRCVVTNTVYAGGVKAITDALKLNISAANGSVVIEQPSAATLISYYASRQLETSVTARTDNGDPVTYEWFVKSFIGPVPTGEAAADTIDEAAALIAASGSKKVSDMPGASVSGNAMTSAPMSEGVYEYTCRVVNANDPSKSLNSPPVYVVVTENSRKPYISVPSAPDTGICSVGVTNGQSITLDCKAWIASDPGDGEDISYQWQTASSADGPWSDLEAATANLTINTVTPTYTGAYFRCIATNVKANESTASIPYRLNVWNVAEVPVIKNGPQNQEVQWTGSVPGNEIAVTSTVTVAQGSDHNTMQPMWWTPNGGAYTTDNNPNLTDPALGGVPNPAHPVTNPTGWEDDWTLPMVSITRSVSGGVVTYTSTLSVPVEEGNITKARAFSGEYSVTWFNNQYINEDTGYNVEVNQKAPADTTFLVAPQATSDTANVLVLISGTPRIPVETPASHETTAAIGETASFSVTALLNENQNENPKGELVYVWQVTKDGGATWNNALSVDGTGQFSNTFTTIPLTVAMYDNSTASNVPGPGTAGTIGNARTVYAYRCIVANRTTGMKATSGVFNLVITADAAPAAEPTLTPGAGSPITIEGTAPNRYALGVTVSKEGTTVSKFLEDFNMSVPAGYELRVVGSDGTVLADNDIVYTGCILQLVKTATDEVVDQATIIVAGDVLGNGIIAINQVVRMAQDLNGTRPLEGIFEMAGDFNGNGSIDIADLVREAQILNEEINVNK